ncbi:hypothetical protein PINS_up022479 [Pythium insidiosum]|nr:hypothetical protein PINS_up022479 [Pythium insidiosum]
MLRDMRAQAAEEHLAASRQQGALLKKARDAINRDSASEPESDDDWRDFRDEQGYQFWFSPSRNERHYVRPNDHALAKSLLGMPCRVFWPLEQQWFTGRVTRYNHSKDKHRVDYDDGDHEWLRVATEGDRVQVHNGFCWCMARMYEPALRTLKAAIFLMLRVSHYDVSARAWRTGLIEAFNEQSDHFLVTYDDDGRRETGVGRALSHGKRCAGAGRIDAAMVFAQRVRLWSVARASCGEYQGY